MNFKSDMYSEKPKNSDLPIFNKFTPRKHSKRVLVKRFFYVLLLILITYTIYLRLFVGNASISDQLKKQDLDQQPIDDQDYEVYKVTKDGVQKQESEQVQDTEIEVEGELPEVTTEDLYRGNVDIFDLNEYQGSREGAKNKDILLFLMPLRNAEHVLPMAFYNLMNLTYDHTLIDIAFLVSDCSPDDTTLETVFEYSVALQNGTLVDLLNSEKDSKNSANVQGTSDLYQSYMEPSYIDGVKKAYSNPESHHPHYRTPFRSVTIFKKDFGQVIGQGFSDRHAVKVQGIRRKLMGRARNWLTSAALKPYHSWVYWRDADIETCPGNVIEELMSHDYDVMVPNVWRPLPTFLGNEQPYDLNSWVESDAGLELAKSLDEDDVIVEGYAEYPTWRAHLAYIRDANGNPREVIDLDGVGGVSILARAKIFRQGVHFPAFTFLNHAETEAFGKMAKKMGFRVGGLPHYTIWHIYEPSEDDLKEIARLERKKRRQKN